MKAQGSLELLVVFGVLMMIFTAIVQQFYFKTKDTEITTERSELETLCIEISRAILSARITGNGYHETVSFNDVNLSFFPEVRTLDIDRKIACYLPTSQIIVNSVGKYELDIYNVNGSVVIE